MNKDEDNEGMKLTQKQSARKFVEYWTLQRGSEEGGKSGPSKAIFYTGMYSRC
jgi:hypothetical protein